MPYTLSNPESHIDYTLGSKDDYGYKYPNNLDLKPGSKLHQETLGKLLSYARDSASIISRRFDKWVEIDNKLQAFIPISAEEAQVKRADPRKPVSIVFPYSYAILETLVSYLVSAFTPEPIFRYEGVGPEDTAGATLMERVINVHCAKTKVGLNLHTLFRDASAYGLGIVTPQWIVRRGRKRNRGTNNSLVDENNNTIRVEMFSSLSAGENVILFEGNGLDNIDPYCYLPDPNVPIHNVQRGEYVGWLDRDNFLNLLADEELDGDLFNVQYLRRCVNKFTSVYGNSAYPRQSRNHLGNDSFVSLYSAPIDLLHMYVKLIPSVWNLGDNEYPEKWMFTIGADSVIIRANRLELDHDMYPVCVTAPEFDGYSPVSFSRMEILQGMQTIVDWMFNSHVVNVRKAINDVLVIDPYLLNVNDLENVEAGGFVRTRRPAWGRGVENSFKQLAMTDITRNNITDVTFIIEFMRQIAGTDNPMMGNLRQGGPDRLTAKEFQGTSVGAVNRLERTAKIVGIQAMQDIGYMFAMHTQQFMNDPIYVKTTGDWSESIKRNFAIEEGRVLVKPQDILVDYDLLIRDGSIPGGAYSDSWIQILDIASKNPVLAQRLDLMRLFKYIATNLGAKNVEDFELGGESAKQIPVGMTTMPDEEVEQQVNSGTLAPLMAMNGATI
jgi:hypothetical protein